MNNTFYIDYENGVYLDCYNYHKEIFEMMHFFERLGQIKNKQKELLNENKYNLFYMMIPEALRVYDFQKRYKEIDTDKIAEIWLDVYTSLDYGFDSWNEEVLEYVFQYHKPSQIKKPFTIYRGIGTESTPIEKAYSWTTDIDKAYWFAPEEVLVKPLPKE
jgi:hypothetical protein